EQARERRRYAYRAAAVGTDGDWRHTGRDARRGAGARPAGGLAQVPRIARTSGQRRFADRLAAEFAGGRLADDDRASAPQAFDCDRIASRDVAGHAAGAKSKRRIGDGDEILDRDGNAEER